MKIWELELAPTKCAVMRVKNTFRANVYNLNGHIIPIKSSFKYMGITFSDNISFNIHINNICNKDYLIINRLFRCFITNNYIYLLKSYISYVRPLVESDSSVWNPDPLYITNSNDITNIQNYFTNDYLVDVIFPYVLTPIDLFFSILNNYHFADW